MGGRLLRQRRDTYPLPRPVGLGGDPLQQLLLHEPGLLPGAGEPDDRTHPLGARSARLDPRGQHAARSRPLPRRTDLLYRCPGRQRLHRRAQRQVAPRRQHDAAARLQPLVRIAHRRQPVQRRGHDPGRAGRNAARVPHGRDHKRRAGFHLRPPGGAVLPQRQLQRAAYPVHGAPPGDRRLLRRLSVQDLSAGGIAPVGGAGGGRSHGQPRVVERVFRGDNGARLQRRADPRTAGAARYSRQHARRLQQRQRLLVRASRVLAQGERHLSAEHVRELGEGPLHRQPARQDPRRDGSARRW